MVIQIREWNGNNGFSHWLYSNHIELYIKSEAKQDKRESKREKAQLTTPFQC